MNSQTEQDYLSLRKEIKDYLEKESTKKKIYEYSDKKLAKAHLKKHLYLSCKGSMGDIQKILDELL